MPVVLEVRDSFNQLLPNYGFTLDPGELDDYTDLARIILQTVRDGDWRAHKVQFSIGGRPVGTATYQSGEAA
ncbi:hypothetical protein [Bradyrhizobium sp. ORS 86]|uniref:hypothetical protein n=1 Tax=Bradyrhizobium sp. ORS 86 TaxID=1685970 RepID=UPI003890E31B